MGKKNIDYNKLPECDLLDDYIIKRLKKGLHCHILVTGLQGTGKSDFSIRMAERITEKLNNGTVFGRDDIVDSLLKLLERITKIKQPGEVIVIEEVSVLFPSRRSMSADNVAIGRILDTIRKKRAILISNAPLYPSIDLHMRSLAEILVECQGVIRSANLVKVKAWWLETAPHTGKTYRHTFTRRGFKVRFHYSKQSNPEVRKLYEKDKDKFIDNLMIRLRDKAMKTEEKETGLSAKEHLMRREIIRLLKDEHLPIKEIAKRLGTGTRLIYKHIAIIEKNEPNLRFSLEKPQKSPLEPNIAAI